MPALKDLAALPTSWALTLWDALPLYLSIEVAIAMALVALTSGTTRGKLWSITRCYPVGAILYAALFDARLMLIIAAFSAGQTVHAFVRSTNEPELPIPDSPPQAMRLRGGSVIWDVAKAAGVAAVIKILVTPELAPGAYTWLAVAIIGAIIAPGPFGVAAIPTLAIASASDSLLAPVLWLLVAALRPWVLSRLSSWRSPGEPAASHPTPES